MPRSLLVTLCVVVAPVGAFAQQTPPPPPPLDVVVMRPGGILEGAVGLASFVDDATIEYAYVGGSCRSYLSRRIAIGPCR